MHKGAYGSKGGQGRFGRAQFKPSRNTGSQIQHGLMRERSKTNESDSDASVDAALVRLMTEVTTFFFEIIFGKCIILRAD